MRILDPILRAGEGRLRRKLEHLTALVNDSEDTYRPLSDTDLAAQTDIFRSRLSGGESVDDLLPEAFAVVREASRRVLRMRHFDVQVMGGAALHLGNIAEMRTGEGKTLVATLPAYLNALTGDGVHVVTVNDYLAARDAATMGKVHTFLGLTVGVVTSDLDAEERRAAYACDITYGTNNELGFDYLRDNMALDRDQLVQRGHHFAIVDEVDSILIDEARTPLVLSGPGEPVSGWHREFARLAARLTRGVDYDVDDVKETVGLRSTGVAKVEGWVGAENLYTLEHTALVGLLNQAVRAKELYRRDKDYIVTGGKVAIVDEHTGRVLAGRRYSDGLHQALEAKEGVRVELENPTLATITLQNYFRSYTRLAGMTGTGSSEAAELHQTYGLGVVPIPSNQPNRRIDRADVVYRTEDAKFAAVVTDIVTRHRTGQPILVGTTSVDSSERLSTLLAAECIEHQVLNAKNHEREAHVIAQAGRYGAVTVATNMAGRGTDIVLGGNADELAAEDLRGQGVGPGDAEWADRWDTALAAARQQATDERQRVAAAGGLYVVGTERHESRRIDDQLRGRAGRQGDPGETRFYLSLEDEIMRKFAGRTLTRAMDSLGAGDIPIESKMVNSSVASAQSSMESNHYEARKEVLKYDDVLSRQREVIYAQRRRVLDSGDASAQVRTMTRQVVAGLVAQLDGPAETWDLDQLIAAVAEFVPIDLTANDLLDAAGSEPGTLTVPRLTDLVTAAADRAYDAREKSLGAERMRHIERRVLLTVVDRKWREHLTEMDYMREGIGMRAFASKNPLVEYQREAYDMFLTLLAAIKEETVGYVFHLAVPEPDAEDAGAEDAGAEDAGAEDISEVDAGPGQRPERDERQSGMTLEDVEEV